MNPQEEPPLSAASHNLPIHFTGSGGGYFQVWIVNLVLTVCTLSLYAPFARARRLRYFHRHTFVGTDPLAFHGDPWKMLRGHLLMLATGGVLFAVARFCAQWLWVPLLALMLAWPWLWHTALRFRIGNTSWRGVRMAFVGDLAGAYACLLPFFVPLLACLLLLAQAGGPGQRVALAEPPFLVGLTVIGFLAFAICLPWLGARVARYVQSGYVYAQQHTRLDVDTGSFYKLSCKTSCVMLLTLLPGMAIGRAAAFAFSSTLAKPLVHTLAFGASFCVLLPLLLKPYAVSRSQNLLWSHTRSRRLRFSSRLRFGPLLRLHAANGLLIVLTLGLYWPYARVRMARLRLESVSLAVEGDVDQWQARHRAAGQRTLGDDAVDFLGIDILI